jgi:hypothetical protein
VPPRNSAGLPASVAPGPAAALASVGCIADSPAPTSHQPPHLTNHAESLDATSEGCLVASLPAPLVYTIAGLINRSSVCLRQARPRAHARSSGCRYFAPSGRNAAVLGPSHRLPTLLPRRVRC